MVQFLRKGAAVEMERTLEDNEENKVLVEELLEGDTVTVTVMDDGAMFKKGGEVVVFERMALGHNNSSVVTSDDLTAMNDLTQHVMVVADGNEPSAAAKRRHTDDVVKEVEVTKSVAAIS